MLYTRISHHNIHYHVPPRPLRENPAQEDAYNANYEATMSGDLNISTSQHDE